ncbi:hypothetical protein QBC46DRAFT_375096 [Diplogelasinospora grovesii]|uniref:Uncharacterized protein n=1 Tax=Diplogelasinospora grovesii TaxID=303347 RepID=A0AAN6NF73_9PEZI|nr:hypothetical protein QBC46DRAFT_375096 [Diplogelasinospora grovesii]
MGIGARHGSALRAFLRKKTPTPLELQHALQLVEWRTAAMDLVDFFVGVLGLPRPHGKECALWDRRVPFSSHMSPALKDRNSQILQQLKVEGFVSIVPFINRGDFPCAKFPFNRPTYYYMAACMAACMALSDMEPSSITRAIDRMKVLQRRWERQERR